MALEHEPPLMGDMVSRLKMREPFEDACAEDNRLIPVVESCWMGFYGVAKASKTELP